MLKFINLTACCVCATISMAILMVVSEKEFLRGFKAGKEYIETKEKWRDNKNEIN